MKDDLRYKYKIKRKYFQHSAREVADGAIADGVFEYFKDKQVFFVYYSYGSEADTHALIERLLSAGKQVLLPRVEDKDMVMVNYNRGDNLVKNPYGIYEPQGQVFSGEPQVCIAPLLCVNERGFRLGYGGGYYDRFFAAHPNCIRAGIGYFLQYAQDFKEDEWDKPLDLFICERGIISFDGR